MRETIDETTVGDLAGVRVGMGNMTHGSYDTPDGARQGIIGALAVPGRVGQFVGLDSEIEVDGRLWRVVDIEKEKGKPGSVTLELVTG